jgi:hypothetical protein
MKRQANAVPPRQTVTRGFETNRLAKDFQTRAYEQVSALSNNPSRAVADQDPSKSNKQERIAA